MTTSEEPQGRTRRHPQASMARIKATCPTCGDVDLTPARVRLVECSAPERSFYAFDCSTCLQEVRKHAAQDVIDALTLAGTVVESWVIPAEALEAHAGVAIGWDDVLDFHLALDDLDVLAAIALPAQASGTPAALRPW